MKKDTYLQLRIWTKILLHKVFLITLFWKVRMCKYWTLIGWMQLIILVYHMSGASQNLSIYMFIRVLVSSYLFLNGYGHLCHHWKQQQKQDQTPNGIDSGRFQDFDGIVRFLSVRETVYYKLLGICNNVYLCLGSLMFSSNKLSNLKRPEKNW